MSPGEVGLVLLITDEVKARNMPQGQLTEMLKILTEGG
jgi:hypothetical protein